MNDVVIQEYNNLKEEGHLSLLVARTRGYLDKRESLVSLL